MDRESDDRVPFLEQLARRKLALVVLLAFVLRAAAVFLPIDYRAPDTESYDAPARSMARGEGYLDAEGRPTSERPPGYPAFLALVYVLSGTTSPRAVGLAQALLGAATVALVHRLLARRSPRAALLAAFVLAIDPAAIGCAPYVLREALLLFLLTLLLVLLDAGRGREPSSPRSAGPPSEPEGWPRSAWARGLAVGMVLAALGLTHQLYFALGPFLFVEHLLARKRILPIIVAGAIVVAAWAGWTARNLGVGSKQLMLTSYPVPAGELWLMSENTNDWLHDDPTTGYQETHFREIARLQREHPGDIAAVKRELYARAWANFVREPLTVVARVARVNLWYWLEVPGSVRLSLSPRLWVLRLGLIPFHWLRLLWAIVGVVGLARGRRVAKTNGISPSSPEPLSGMPGEDSHPTLATFSSETATWAFLALAPSLLLPIPRYLSPLASVLDAFAAMGIVGERDRRQRALIPPTTEVDASAKNDPRRS